MERFADAIQLCPGKGDKTINENGDVNIGWNHKYFAVYYFLFIINENLNYNSADALQ